MKKGYEHLLVRLWGQAYASDSRYHDWKTNVEHKFGPGYAEADLCDKLHELHKESSPRAGSGGW